MPPPSTLTRRCHLSRYSSHSLSAGDPPGTAIFSGYGGHFRGVCFHPPPCPLETFSDGGASEGGGLSTAAVEASLASLLPAIGELGGWLRIEARPFPSRGRPRDGAS